MRNPNVIDGTRENDLGEHKVYRFDNGYGASVVRGSYTYGGPYLWELAVLKWDGEECNLCYTTPITDDVIGWLNEDAVDDLLEKIEKLVQEQ
jgi:hypothetical protein